MSNILLFLSQICSKHKLAVQSKLGLQRLAQLVSRAAVVHLKFLAGSTIPVPVCTVPSSMDRTSRCNKVDTVRLYASYRLNLLLLKGKRCIIYYNVHWWSMIQQEEKPKQNILKTDDICLCYITNLFLFSLDFAILCV